MCELLVRLVSKVNDDPYLDAMCSKRGDVIVVVPDGHEWGRDEISSPDWKIVKVPGVAVEDASGFMAKEIDEGEDSAVLQRKAFAFDLEAEPANLDELMAAKVRKPKLVDPNVL